MSTNYKIINCICARKIQLTNFFNYFFRKSELYRLFCLKKVLKSALFINWAPALPLKMSFHLPKLSRFIVSVRITNHISCCSLGLLAQWAFHPHFPCLFVCLFVWSPPSLYVPIKQNTEVKNKIVIISINTSRDFFLKRLERKLDCIHWGKCLKATTSNHNISDVCVCVCVYALS